MLFRQNPRRLCGYFLVLFLAVQAIALWHRHHHESFKSLPGHESSLCQVLDHASSDNTLIAKLSNWITPRVVSDSFIAFVPSSPHPISFKAFLARAPPQTLAC